MKAVDIVAPHGLIAGDEQSIDDKLTLCGRPEEQQQSHRCGNNSPDIHDKAPSSAGGL